MNVKELAIANSQVKVILIGESHANPNVNMVLSIVREFENRGHNLTFYFEHFPGQPAQVEQLSTGEITPQAFMTTPVNYPASGGIVQKTPEQYWEHPEQSGKLLTLLQFAQERFIAIRGHDLLQTSFDKAGYESWQKRRDMRMALYMMSDIKKSNFGTAVAFIGDLHVAPQANILRQHLKADKIITLRPNDSLVDGVIVEVKEDSKDYRFKP